jgi:hypothetical protein
MHHLITCKECRHSQKAREAAAHGARCASPTCGIALCLWCGCSTLKPCVVPPPLHKPQSDRCRQFIRGACSHPACVEQAYRFIAHPPKPTLADLYEGAPLDESSLSHIIINSLMSEAQGYTLAALRIDCFDLIEGSYPASAYEVVSEIFIEWNGRIGHEFFCAGRNLLASSIEAGT